MKVDRPVISDGETSEIEWPPRDMRVVRRIAMLLVPLLVVLCVGLTYAYGGRFIATDNAYVKADIVALSPEISGTVERVLVNENQRVTKGQELVGIDATQHEIALAAADAEIRKAAAEYQADRALYRQKVEGLRIAETDATFANRELERQTALGSGRFVSVSKLDEVRHLRDTAVQRTALLKQEQAEILARLDGDPDLPLERYPGYQAGVAQRATAEFFLKNAVVTAPFDGVVSRLPKAGDFGRTGVPLLSIVSADIVWIDANYKETEITHFQPGQPAEISVDTYPGCIFKAHVDSIAQASGAEFALLPAQNTTGNWVKVVQRIPVRIAIGEPSCKDRVLRAGMSVTATVDTGTRRFQRWLGREEP